MISTTCKNCTFKLMDGFHQVGCEIGMLKKFKSVGDEVLDYVEDEMTYSKVGRVCMHRREETWRESGGTRSLLFEETFIRSTFVVIHKAGASLGDLEKTLRDINLVDTVRLPKVVVCHEHHKYSEIIGVASEIIPESRLSCVYMVDKLYEDSMYDESFRRCKNGWVIFVDSGTPVKKEMLCAINHASVSEAKKFVEITGEVKAYPAIIYKHLDGYKGMSMSEKVATFNQDGLSVPIEDLYENYRLFRES